MKISCHACAAKYTIADEKVAGKIVKIRCKKCGETITVNGNEMLDEDEPTAMFTVPTAELWTVSFSETDQKTLSVTEIQRDYGLGKINGDTYVWKEGMSDWLPLRDIQSLREAVMGEGDGGPAFDLGVELAADAAGFDEGMFAGEGETVAMKQDFAAPSPDPASSTAGAARRAVKRTGGDLFATNYEMSAVPSPLTTTQNQDAGRGSSPPGGADVKLTGQRNENSVLFSLNSLTANAGNAPPPAARQPTAAQGAVTVQNNKPGYGANEASGLIDIRALASAAGATKPNATAKMDDIMGLGGGGAFASPLGAPMLSPVANYGAPEAAAPAPSSNNGLKMALAGLGVLLVAAVGGLGYMMMGRTPATDDKAPVATTTPPPVVAPAPVVAPPPVIDPLATTPPAVTAPPASTGGKAAGAAGGKAPHAAGGAAAVAAADPPPAAKAPEKPGSLEDEILKAAGGKAPAAKAPASSGSAAAFDRGAASAALNAIAATVGTCKKAGDPSGQGRVSVVFGNNGYAKTATVTEGPFAGTRLGGCIAAKFRSAHIPAFAGGDVPVAKSFSVN